MRKQNCYHSSRDCMLRLRRNHQKCNKAGCSIQRGILKNLFNSIATQITGLVKSVPHHRRSREQSPSKGICKRREQSRGRQSLTSQRDRDQYVRHKKRGIVSHADTEIIRCSRRRAQSKWNRRTTTKRNI